VIITAANSCGSSTCSFVVNITDDQPPLISCPSGIKVQCASAVPPASAAAVTASDNCGTPIIAWSDVVNDSSCINHFTINRTYTATDGAGLQTSCVQVITVSDTIAPTFTLPADVAVFTDANCNYNASPSVTG